MQLVIQMKTLTTAACALVLVACDSSGSMAQLARAPDVASCKSLGETQIEAQPAMSPADQLAALRRQAAARGATHVVSNGDAAGGTLKAEMFACPEEEHALTHAEIRGGV